MKKQYTSPTVTAVGTITDITLGDKDFGVEDSFTFQGIDTCIVGLTCEDTSS